MGQGIVVSTSRSTAEDRTTQVTEVRIDTGGGNIVTGDHFEGASGDSLPVVGDFAVFIDGDGTGTVEIIGYHKGSLVGQAAQGEWREIVRKPDGTPVLEVWGKGDGRLEINGIINGGAFVLDPADGSFTINGVKFDRDGNVTAPGEITAKAGTPGSVTLTQHVHPTGTGPSGPPQPGT